MVRSIVGAAVLACFAAFGAFVACSNDSFEGGTDGGAGDGNVGADRASNDAMGPSDAGDDAAHEGGKEGGCPSGRGPSMVEIKDALHFCIDSTEVSEAEYASFAAVLTPALKQQLSSQVDPFCNTQVLSFPPAPDASSQLPMTHIGWCQAQFFCAWAGKRLCGSADGGIAPNDNVLSSHEWLYACTRGATIPYSYGFTASPGTCNLQYSDGGAPPLEAVGSRPKCTGGYDGIYDMLGSVTEWENSYAGYPDGGNYPNYTRTRGSDALREPYTDDCVNSGNGVDTSVRDNGNPYMGFRCCATP